MQTTTQAKQKLLNNLQEKIKRLQDGYNTILNLPDELFMDDSIVHSKNNGHVTELFGDSYIEAKSNNQAKANNSEHGFIRKTVHSVISDAQRPLKKSEVVERFEAIYPEYKGSRAVTYAITGLQTTGEVKPYKPSNIRIKGNFWTLTEWWDGDRLKEKYRLK